MAWLELAGAVVVVVGACTLLLFAGAKLWNQEDDED
jgi:nitric oxide reductase large subunit